MLGGASKLCMKSIWAIKGANEKLTETERETRQRDAMANGDEADLMDYAEYCGPWPQQQMPFEYFYPSMWGHPWRPVTLREDCLLTQVPSFSRSDDGANGADGGTTLPAPHSYARAGARRTCGPSDYGRGGTAPTRIPQHPATPWASRRTGDYVVHQGRLGPVSHFWGLF